MAPASGSRSSFAATGEERKGENAPTEGASHLVTNCS